MTVRNVLILGHGEIGKSIEKLYKDKEFKVFWKDLEDSSEEIESLFVQKVVVMHVCIPFLDKKAFCKSVLDNVQYFTPELVIINSTVPVGTTSYLSKKLDSDNFGWSGYACDIVHSPVMGVHPNLTEAILTFKKIIGADSPGAFNLAEKHFEELGVTTIPYSSSENSEAAKLLCTTYYGTVIGFMQEVYEYCKEKKLDFEEVYTFTNEIYNDGYEKLGMEFVRRPVLRYMGKGIGGHCVKENADILSKDENGDKLKKVLSLILSRGKP